jgi:hypothetical protein
MDPDQNSDSEKRIRIQEGQYITDPADLIHIWNTGYMLIPPALVYSTVLPDNKGFLNFIYFRAVVLKGGAGRESNTCLQHNGLFHRQCTVVMPQPSA